MLRLPPFAYHPAASLEDAVGMLARYGWRALVVSGGTDLFANMKQRLFTPEVVVGLRPLRELSYVRASEGGVAIGALTTLTHIAEDPVIESRYPALHEAVSVISTPQLRNMGTLGGNICLDTRCNYYNQDYDWRRALGFCMKKDGQVCRVAPKSPTCVAVNSSDSAPVLIAYGATLRLAGPEGRREVPAAEFFRNDGMRPWCKRPDEILTEVRLPALPAGTRAAYRKLRLRNAIDFPILGVAVMLQVEAGVCVRARVVLNAVASKPVEVPDAAAALVGTDLNPRALDEAADAAYAAGKPLDNTSGSIPYRKRMLRVFARRALAACAPGS